MLIIKTSAGDIQVQLYEQEAPVSSRNFLEYVDKGFYDGTIFHRVIPGFMVQGGGYTTDLQRKATMPPIKNEADNGLKNEKYTLAMARTSDPDSATSQYFINTSDNTFLNRDQCQDGVGYAVFGKVVEGTDVVDQIAAVKTGTVSGMQDVPLESVLIETITRT